MRALFIASTIALVVASFGPAEAQRRRGPAYQVPPPALAPQNDRGGYRYAPPAGGGSLRWNTPNADGNFGTRGGSGNAGAGA